MRDQLKSSIRDVKMNICMNSCGHHERTSGLSGWKPQGPQDMRVKEGNIRLQTGHRRVEKAVESRINPLKPPQVVDFPHIELNDRNGRGLEFHEYSENGKGQEPRDPARIAGGAAEGSRCEIVTGPTLCCHSVRAGYVRDVAGSPQAIYVLRTEGGRADFGRTVCNQNPPRYLAT